MNLLGSILDKLEENNLFKAPISLKRKAEAPLSREMKKDKKKGLSKDQSTITLFFFLIKEM